MSKLLDENRIQAKTKTKIEGYGRLAKFFVPDKPNPDVEHEWYITPPRQAKVLSSDGNAPKARMVI